jgi:hypothetical protein
MEHTCTPYDHDDCPGCKDMGMPIKFTGQEVKLYCKNATSDKVYKVVLVPVIVGSDRGKYRIYAAYGKRGSKLVEIEKTKDPLPLWFAEEMMGRLIDEKIKKGYSETDPLVKQLAKQFDLLPLLPIKKVPMKWEAPLGDKWVRDHPEQPKPEDDFVELTTGRRIKDE